MTHRYVDKTRYKIADLTESDLSSEEFMKTITGVYFKIERLIDYFYDRLFYRH